jgi:hypothetical protein
MYVCIRQKSSGSVGNYKGGSPVELHRRGRPTPTFGSPDRTLARSLAPARGVLRRADPAQRADCTAPRSPRAVAPAATPPRLPRDRAPRPRPPHRAPAGAVRGSSNTADRAPASGLYLGRLTRPGKVAGDARGIFDQREQLHPPLAGGTGEHVHGECARQKLRPGAVSAGDIRPTGLVARGGGLGDAWGARRDLHGLAGASTPTWRMVCRRYGGTLVASRHSSDRGSMSTAIVPSAWPSSA